MILFIFDKKIIYFLQQIENVAIIAISKTVPINRVGIDVLKF